VARAGLVLIGILLYALLGKLADVLVKGLARGWLRWHLGYQARGLVQ
jgi:sulfonate transport system permease protein